MPDQDDKNSGGSSDSMASRMAKRVDADKFKSFSQGFDPKPKEDSPGLLDAMKRRMMGQTS